MAQLDVALERGPEQLEVRLGLRAQPHRAALGCGARHVGAQLGRDVDLFLVVLARESDRPGLEGVGVERVEARLQLVEQLPDLGVDEGLVREAADERHVLAALLRARRRHLRPLVPREEHSELPETAENGHPRCELFECVGHGRSLAMAYRRC